MRILDPRRARLEQRTQAIATLMVFVLVVLLLQLWLLTAALDERLSGQGSLAIPTWIASGGCFLANLWLLKCLCDVDRHRE